jgi:hypothetical protein
MTSIRSRNWRRGLLRAWVVFAICWVGFVGGYGMYKWYNDPWHTVSAKPASTACNDYYGHDDPFAAEVCKDRMKICNERGRKDECEEAIRNECDVKYQKGFLRQAECEEAMRAVLPIAPAAPTALAVVLFSIGPPTALLLFGAALYWVGRGFRENT